MMRREFRAMGTDAVLVLDDAGCEGTEAAAALDGAEQEVRRIEAIASRFDPDSELMRLNATGSARVTTDLFRLITAALAMREATGGRFDPTVHAAMVSAGYDRTLDELPDHADAAGPPRPGGGGVRTDVTSGTVTLAPGVALDLGGIAKGWAADRVADMLGVLGPCLVSMGGDMTIRGLHQGEPWPVEVMHGDVARTIGLSRGGMATSGTDRRRWQRAGTAMHHVIDPATGRPSTTDLTRVTTVGDDAATAEAWATALLLAGRHGARREAHERGITAVLVGADGSTTTTGSLA